jgi:flagellar biosynthesis protein FliQ
MKMQRLTKIGIFSLAYTMSLLYLVIGLVLGIITSISVNSPYIATAVQPAVLQFGYWVILIFPAVYFVGGFVMGTVIAFLYNQIVKVTGGVEVELAQGKFKKKK